LCADENIPGDCIRRLRAQGHEVDWIREIMPGASDEQVIAHAGAERRLLLTFDKDFGNQIFRRGIKAANGVILFRISQPSASAVAETIIRVLSSRDDWDRHFSVVDDQTIRMRELKQG
jgi:predicted nuclease of predicted toxin-antitoxin system